MYRQLCNRDKIEYGIHLHLLQCLNVLKFFIHKNYKILRICVQLSMSNSSKGNHCRSAAHIVTHNNSYEH